jgi:methionyl-tRNA synthetase
VADALETFAFDKALAGLFDIVTDVNRDIERHRPWELLKARKTEELRPLLARWLAEVWRLAVWLEPFLPTTSTGIVERLFSGPVRAASPLFPRL